GLRVPARCRHSFAAGGPGEAVSAGPAMRRRTASWFRGATCVGLAFLACKTTEVGPPPTVALPAHAESRTPIYDNLSPPARDAVDRALRTCRDTGGGCSETLLPLENGEPVAMGVAESLCADGRADLCARLGLLHLRGVTRGTSPAEGLRLLDFACQRRLP